MESTYSSSVIGLEALTTSTPGQSFRAVAYARRSSYGLLIRSTEDTSTPASSNNSREKRMFSPVLRARGSTRTSLLGTPSSTARSR
jgi:hypothetical protein